VCGFAARHRVSAETGASRGSSRRLCNPPPYTTTTSHTAYTAQHAAHPASVHPLCSPPQSASTHGWAKKATLIFIHSMLLAQMGPLIHGFDAIQHQGSIHFLVVVDVVIIRCILNRIEQQRRFVRWIPLQRIPQTSRDVFPFQPVPETGLQRPNTRRNSRRDAFARCGQRVDEYGRVCGS
jgi:hypothetical protein